MFQGQLLNKGSAVYSPWMERGGDYVRVSAELIDLGGSGTLKVQVFTKNKEDAGNGSDVDASTFITIASAGRDTVEWGPGTGSGLKELVRYRISESNNASGDWIMFRMLTPVWFNAVDA